MFIPIDSFSVPPASSTGAPSRPTAAKETPPHSWEGGWEVGRGRETRSRRWERPSTCESLTEQPSTQTEMQQWKTWVQYFSSWKDTGWISLHRWVWLFGWTILWIKDCRTDQYSPYSENDKSPHWIGNIWYSYIVDRQSCSHEIMSLRILRNK